VRPRVNAPLSGLLLLASACVGAPEQSEPVPTSTHALLRVERSARIGEESAASATAFAGIVRVPESVDPEPLLRLSGKGLAVPALGQCSAPNRERDTVTNVSFARPEFLAAGEVLLVANHAQTLLAPHVFPSSDTEPSGVVYTTRDRASDPLPEGAAYLLRSTGSEQLPALELRVQAPEHLTDVSVGAVDLASVDEVATGSDLLVQWRPGDARDVVYVEIIAESGTLGVCAFRDSEGFGSLPRGLFGATGPGSLAIHRLREVAAEVPALDGAEVRFDFKLTADVSFR
jgi:hypothetical protein